MQAAVEACCHPSLFFVSGNAVDHVSTSGLKWNLTGQSLSMDGLVRLRPPCLLSCWLLRRWTSFAATSRPASANCLLQISSSNLLLHDPSPERPATVTVTTSGPLLWSLELRTAAAAAAARTSPLVSKL